MVTNRSLVFCIASQHMHFRRVIHKLTYIKLYFISDLEQPKIKKKNKNIQRSLSKYLGPLSWSNWNLECWFLSREENWRPWRKILGARQEPTTKLNPQMTPGRNQTQTTLVGGKCSHHCATLFLLSRLVHVSPSIVQYFQEKSNQNKVMLYMYILNKIVTQ